MRDIQVPDSATEMTYVSFERQIILGVDGFHLKKFGFRLAEILLNLLQMH